MTESGSIKGTALRAAVLGALRTLIDGEYTTSRADVLAEFVEAHDELGVKTVDVSLPTGEKVATLTLVEDTAHAVIEDRAAFTAWVADRHPDNVDTPTDPIQRVVDAVEAAARDLRNRLWVSDEERARIIARYVLAALGLPETPGPRRVQPGAEKDVLGRVIAGEDKAVDPDSGEIIPGVAIRPAGKPSKFQMRYADGGREAIAAAWRAGALGDLVTPPELAEGA